MEPRGETETTLDRTEHPTAPPLPGETDRGATVSPEDSADPMAGATLFGVFYPKHYVVAVYHDQDAAESAAAALREAGFAADDVRTWPGTEVVANHEAYLAERGVLQKIGSLFPSEEHDVLNDYLEQARAGGALLTVLAPDEAQRQTAAPILAAHGGSFMHYYGDNTIIDLTLDDRSNQQGALPDPDRSPS